MKKLFILLVVFLLILPFQTVSAHAKKLPLASVFKVVIDPGHGVRDSGTLEKKGTMEKNLTLSLALKVNRLLLQVPQIQPILTRSTDSTVPLGQRYKKANRLAADVYLSIHADESKSTAGGTESYYAHKDSSGFARILQKHVQAATGFSDRGVKQANYLVIKDTSMPAALVEVGFLSNAKEEKALFTAANQVKIASAMVEAFKEYFHI
jgi:N-acetylmuramoyl-L-alanine amidase